MRQLDEALRPHPDSGIGSEEIITLGNKYSNFSDKNTMPSTPTGAEICRILYPKLQKFPHLRQALSSVNAARAFKYGPRSFGQKRLYTEDFDFSRGLKNNNNDLVF